MITSKQLYRILSFVYFAIFWLNAPIAYAQGLCDKNNWPPNAVEGSFKIEGDITAGCSPLTIKLKDLSGGKDLHYDFYYDGRSDYSLNKLENQDSINVYFTSNIPKVYKILQYGNKNGQQMLSCLNFTIYPPLNVSYTVCNDLVSIEIPKQLIPDNSKIGYQFGQTAAYSFSNSDLPISSNPLSTSLPIELKYYLLINSGNKLCENKINIIKPSTTTGTVNNPYWARIKTIEMKESNKAILEFTGSFGKDGYDLFMNPKNSTFSTIPIKSNIPPGKYEISLPDSVNSYCFYLSRKEICGGTERSADICTIPLEPILALQTQNVLKWSSHPLYFYNSLVPLPLIFGYRTVNNTILKEEKNKKSTIKLNNSNTHLYTDSIDCKKEYCYQILSKSTGELFSYPFEGESKSIKRCINRKDIKTPPITNIILSVDDLQKNSIKFIDNSNWSLKKESFYLYKLQDSTFLKIDSSLAFGSFFDKNSSPNIKSDCYSIGYKDECGSLSEIKARVCNVLLKSNDNNILTWNDSVPFGNSNISSFELYSSDDISNLPSKHSILSSTSREIKIDLNNFEYEAQYKLKIISSEGDESFSNLVKIPIDALFFIPEIFTPNGDNINEELEVKGKFGMIKDFALTIFNRWGEKIVTIKDKTQNWDGNYKGKPVKPDTYFFTLYIVLNTGEKIQKKGKFEIVNY